MENILHVLTVSPLLLLFVVIGIGSLLGSVKIFGFSLGPAAVLFTGILFGALDPRLVVPDFVYILGLILFVYTIGLQSGPSFFASFGKRSLRANVFAVGAVFLAAGLSYLFWHVLSLDGPTTVGMFCGSLTNTPALAATIETVKEVARVGGASAEQIIRAANAPVIGYSITYPFGVIGVLVGFYIMAKVKKGRPDESADLGADAGGPAGPIVAKTFRVLNPGIIGRSIREILAGTENPGFVLSRLKRDTVTSLVYADTVLQKDDLIVAVGGTASLDRAKMIFGEESPHDIHTDHQEFDFKRIEVSDRKIVGKTIRELNLQDMLDATITRIRRGDVDFVPNADTAVERGDRVRVITWSGNMERVVRFFGDSVKSSAEADFVSFSTGLVLGVLLGMVPLPLPNGSSFTLGFAGGPLIMGLILGRVQRTGPLFWGLPFSVNLTLRQFGLVLFLAGIGAKAGIGFLPTMAAGGWRLMAVGGVITAAVTMTVLYLGARYLRISVPATMGLMSGIQTQPACLAYANEHSGSNSPNVWYASVYPASMIAKIILAQILVTLLL